MFRVATRAGLWKPHVRGIHTSAARAGSAIPVRLRRSAMFVPGSNDRAVAKAPSLSVDAVILDLEDAVAPAAKGEARDKVTQAVLQHTASHPELGIRINPLSTQWGTDDLAAAAHANPAFIMIPKVESAETVVECADWLDQNAPDCSSVIWPLIETPLGVLRALDIAQSHARIETLAVGTVDLTSDLRARHTPDRQPLLTSLSLVVLAARAAGIHVLDGVHLNVRDLDGFRDVCVQTLIHPSTVDIANEVFSPSPGEVEHAREIVEEFDRANAEGRGVVVVRGKLVERMHHRDAQELLAVHDWVMRRSSPEE